MIGGLALGAVGLASALSGCGGASVATTPTTSLHAFVLVSPVLPKSHVLPKRYTCNPKIGVPPLEWEALPPSTTDLALVVYFLGNGQPEPMAALTGMKSTLRELKPGVIPSGAVIAANSKVICPTGGLTATYFIRLYALKGPPKLAHGATVAAVASAIAPLAVGVGSVEVHYKK